MHPSRKDCILVGGWCWFQPWFEWWWEKSSMKCTPSRSIKQGMYGNLVSLLLSNLHTDDDIMAAIGCLLGSEGWSMCCLCNRSISQIPQCTSPTSHNAPFCYRNVHMCTFLLQSGALWDICLMHCGICEMGLYQCWAVYNLVLWFTIL